MSSPLISTQTLIANHPQLSEKVLIDFVNGIEVIDDHIRVRELNNQSFAGRLWADLTGQSHLRQHTIDQHINHSLNAVSDWLQFLQHTQIQSDLAITQVSDKLAETRAGVMRLNAKHNELAQQVKQLLVEFERLDDKLHQLTAKVLQVDAGRLAMQHLDAVFVKWEAGRFNHYPLITRLFLVFDELHWGDFGNYCRKYVHDHEIEITRLIQQAKDKAMIQLKQEMNFEGVWAWREQLATEIQQLPQECQHVLAYLSNDAQIETTPMLWAVNQLATGQSTLENCPALPFVFNTDSVIQSFARDFGVRNGR